LDAAASGWNVVEREGISVQHPSRFIFVGTMNPEEGELRPQILDRFALHAKVEPIKDLEQRMEQLVCYAAPAEMWESDILPGYFPFLVNDIKGKADCQCILAW
jgi:hypothetical protein